MPDPLFTEHSILIWPLYTGEERGFCETTAA
jgi:hypothetical protein